MAKELKVRIKELHKYREHGVTQQSQLIHFEQMRFRRELKLKRIGSKIKNGNGSSGTSTPTPAASARFLPQAGDFSLKAILDPHYEEKAVLQPLQLIKNKKRPKKSLWSRKKEKTGRRLLLQ